MSETSIYPEVRKIIADKITNGEVVIIDWLTHEIIASKAGIEGPDTEFPSAANPVEAVADPQIPRPSATAEVSSSEAPPPPGVTEKAEAPFSSQDASAALHCPAIQAGADGHPSEPTPDALVAGQGAMPGSVAKSGEAVTTSKPGCLSPDHCRIKFQTSALCWKCRDAQTKARAA